MMILIHGLQPILTVLVHAAKKPFAHSATCTCLGLRAAAQWYRQVVDEC